MIMKHKRIIQRSISFNINKYYFANSKKNKSKVFKYNTLFFNY